MMKVRSFLLVVSFLFSVCNLNAQKTMTDPCEGKVLSTWKEQIEFVKECAEKRHERPKTDGLQRTG